MLLALPSEGMRPSKTQHRSDLKIFVDWIEASATFLGGSVYTPQVVDFLLENNIYRDQGFAWAFVERAVSVIRIRKTLLGDGYPIELLDDGFSFNDNWSDFLPYAFCLFLSMSQIFPRWKADLLNNDYTAQGELFERFSAESLASLFPGWKVRATGWSRTRVVSLNRVVQSIAQWLNEETGNVSRWTSDQAKEAGLDLLSYRSFADANVGIPVFMWQCASGQKWRDKRKSPDLDIWNRLIGWAVLPRKGLTVPFALDDDEIRKDSLAVQGLLLDRHRLLEPGQTSRNWLSADLSAEILGWMTPLVAQLPVLEENAL